MCCFPGEEESVRLGKAGMVPPLWPFILPRLLGQVLPPARRHLGALVPREHSTYWRAGQGYTSSSRSCWFSLESSSSQRTLALSCGSLIHLLWSDTALRMYLNIPVYLFLFPIRSTFFFFFLLPKQASRGVIKRASCKLTEAGNTTRLKKARRIWKKAINALNYRCGQEQLLLLRLPTLPLSRPCFHLLITLSKFHHWSRNFP